MPWLSLALAVALVTLPPPEATGGPAPTPDPVPVRVFLDCQTVGCDFDFFRTEIRWVDWVRDRQDSDVHVIVTSQPTGGGGRQFQSDFQGRGGFAGDGFTLTHTTSTNDSQDDVRRALLRTLSLGLARFAAETEVGERLQVVLRGETAAAAPQPGDPATPPAAVQDDPWNFWVFSTSANAFASGESSAGSQNYRGSLSATRTTDDWKIQISANGSYGESRFELPDRTVKSITRTYSATGLVVHSLGERWSGGFRTGARTSTFLNQDLSLEFSPAVEFSVFPYAENTRRALTFEYSIGPRYFNYTEETIYEQEEETLWEHGLTTSLNLRQPWGTVRTTLAGAHYLHDPGLHEVTLGTNLNLRLFRGFSLDLGGNYSRVRNQLHLPRRGASEEEVLLRRRQLETSYRYFTTVGIRYTFGSIFSNVVNPRMSGSSGGGIIMMF